MKANIYDKKSVKNQKSASLQLTMTTTAYNNHNSKSLRQYNEKIAKTPGSFNSVERQNVHLDVQKKPSLFRSSHSENAQNEEKDAKSNKQSFFSQEIEPKTQPISIMTKRIGFRRRSCMNNSALIIIWLDV